MTRHVLFFLDKEWPPAHSFVDGFICNAKFLQYVRPELFVTSLRKGDKFALYRGVACQRVLAKRRGIGRILRFVQVFRILRSRASNDKELTVFVRNDPLVLAACGIAKKIGLVKRLIYQNSFPHEETRGILGKVTKILLSVFGRTCDAIYVVSDLAQLRMRRYAPGVRLRIVPLLVQDDMLVGRSWQENAEGVVRYVYIGTLARGRRIDFLIECFYYAYSKGEKFHLKIVGGNERDISYLRSLHVTKELEDLGLVRFVGKVPREEVKKHLADCDVGISVVPPSDVYRESSPTKLGEYLGHGLAVLVTRGIDYQDRIALDSGACFICDYDLEEIADAICRINKTSRLTMLEMGQRGLEFARQRLSYSGIIDEVVGDYGVSVR